MIEDYSIRKIDISTPFDKAALFSFLASFSLRYEDDIDVAYGIFDSSELLLGCGCAAGNLLKCFAVSDVLRNQNSLGPLVSALVQDRFLHCIYDLFIITRVHNEILFNSCGFHTVVRTPSLVMLENIPRGPQTFASRFCQIDEASKTVGSIVMNCNPFTLGHQYLVEQAAAQCDILHIFVVEEDRSLFPTDVRLQLVQEGVSHLSNVFVHLSSHYMISAATFPTYFLKDNEDSVALQSELDVTLFAEAIAPVLHIKKRFAGQEPLDPTTAKYNEAMCRILPKYGIEFCEIPRKSQEGRPISASYVRSLLSSPDTFHDALEFLPPCTKNYLKRTRGCT